MTATNLARLPNLVKCQLLQSDLSFDYQCELFSKRVNNICAHYFNDDAGSHQSCMDVGFYNSEVVQTWVHNALVTHWQIPFFALKAREGYLFLVGEYLGSDASFSAGKSFSHLREVRTKLAGGLWLGERCANEAQAISLRASIQNVYSRLSAKSAARKVMKQTDTQVNESLHGVPSRVFPKDMNHGDSSEYVYTMSA